jgi:predicted Zn-ribbon and HTH transcriptional regulator
MQLVEKHSVCPNCKSGSTYRSRRRGRLEFFLHYFLFTSPYRCKDCQTRYFRTRMAKGARRGAAKQTSSTHAAHGA